MMALATLRYVVLAVAVSLYYLALPYMNEKHAVALYETSPHDRGVREGEYIKNAQGLWLFTRSYAVENPKAIIFACHGLAEYSIRFSQFGPYVNEHGISLYAVDLQGHGFSEGERTHVEEWSHFIDDFNLMVDTRIRELGVKADVPKFIVANSMGGVIALASVQRRPGMFTGLVLTAPALMENIKTPIPRWILLPIAKYISAALPRWGITKMNPLKSTKNATVADILLNDPYHNKNWIPARFGWTFIETAAKVITNTTLVKEPVLVMHGSEDIVTLMAGTTKLIEDVATPAEHKKLIVYENYGHELWIAHVKERVYADSLAFIQEKMPLYTKSSV